MGMRAVVNVACLSGNRYNVLLRGIVEMGSGNQAYSDGLEGGRKSASAEWWQRQHIDGRDVSTKITNGVYQQHIFVGCGNVAKRNLFGPSANRWQRGRWFA